MEEGVVAEKMKGVRKASTLLEEQSPVEDPGWSQVHRGAGLAAHKDAGNNARGKRREEERGKKNSKNRLVVQEQTELCSKQVLERQVCKRVDGENLIVPCH